MHCINDIKTAITLSRLFTPSSSSVDISRQATALGTEYDLYQRTGANRRSLIMIHGLTTNGERDHRMVRFAQAYALAGFRVAAISLPGLKSCRLTKGDLECTCDLIRSMHRESAGKIGIVAFSFGAGIGLTAATAPVVNKKVDPVVLFGPYYSAVDCWDHLLELMNEEPHDAHLWEIFIYIAMALAHQQQEHLKLKESERQELVAQLSAFCTTPDISGKKQFYDRVLKKHYMEIIEGAKSDVSLLETLSPKGKLHNLTSRVFLIHDQNDILIPPSHSRRILDEIQAGHLVSRNSILVTPILSHVSMGSLWRIPDLFRLLGMLGSLFDDIVPSADETKCNG